MLTPVELPSEDAPDRVNDSSFYEGKEIPAVATAVEEIEINDKLATDTDFAQYFTKQDMERMFRTSATRGLDTNVAQEYLAKFGPNELEKKPPPTFLMLFLLQLVSFVILLLLGAAVASILVNVTDEKRRGDVLSYTTGKMIFVLVLVNAAIAAYVEAKAGNGLDALAKLGAAKVTVLRDGSKGEVPAAGLVQGDVVLLGTGDVVPADCRVVVDDDFKVSEMPLTGEPDDRIKVSKIPLKGSTDQDFVQDNMVYSGCNVTNGKGTVVVVDTGMRTKIGKIASRLNESDSDNVSDNTLKGQGKTRWCSCLPDTSASQTPLQKNVEKLGANIAVLALGTCAIVYVLGGILGTKDPEAADTNPWLYMIVIAVTLAVAAIPEGIPLCVTISLSIGCSKMMGKNVLIKKIAAVETLGSASVICSDKTGTLTEAKMTMQQLWSGGTQFAVSGKGFEPIGSFTVVETGAPANEDPSVLATLKTALLCCDTTLEQEADTGTWKVNGNSSEGPIVVASRKVGLVEKQVREQNPLLFQVPFSSSRKMMLTVTDMKAQGEICEGGYKLPGKYLSVVKGAPAFLMAECSKIVQKDGSVVDLTDDMRAELEQVNSRWASQALRVLACATNVTVEPPCDFKSEELTVDQKFSLCRKELTFVGMWAALDPERDGVPEAVLSARGAGIKVIMITGDALETAVAIAKNVNILKAEDGSEAECARDCRALRPTGLKPEDYLPDHEIDDMTSSVRVFARAQPEDKLVIVKSLQRQRMVVAMTGDGVNDAPALDKAEIGVAMGIQGTEVAKGAADMVLQDDNFCRIVDAVELGRAIYDGIQKFVAFIMSVHIAEVIQIIVCIALGIPIMRTPLQILFLIIVTDLPPSIALGMEPGEKSNMKKKPRPKEEPIVLPFMWVSIVLNGFILSAVIIAVYLVALLHYCDGVFLLEDILLIENDRDEKLMAARTVAFVSLVFSENVRAYTSRSFSQFFYKNFLGNTCMQYAVVAAQCCLIVAVFTPFFSDKILGLSGTVIWSWGWIVALAGPVATLLLCELGKVATSWQMNRYYSRQR